MQYFGKWYNPNTAAIQESEFGNGNIIDDFNKLGFVDYEHHGYINKPVQKRVRETDYFPAWSRKIKWKNDTTNNLYFLLHSPGSNDYGDSYTFSLQIKNGYNSYGINQPVTAYNFNITCFQFIPLINGGFLLDACHGPSFGTRLTDPIPPFSMNITYDTVRPSDNYGTIVCVSPSKDSQSSEFLYFCNGMWYYPGASHEHPSKNPWNNIFYNKKCDNVTVYNDEQGSRTINTNISNKYIMTKIPHFDGFLDNIYLMTSKPASLQVNDYFTIDNKTYLLLFNNFVVEVAE